MRALTPIEAPADDGTIIHHLDVFEIEPLPLDHPLRRFNNAILLSHRGYATVEILRERYEEAITNILNFMDSKPVNLLNPEVLKP